MTPRGLNVTMPTAKICLECESHLLHPLDGELCCDKIRHPDFDAPCPGLWRRARVCPEGKWERKIPERK